MNITELLDRPIAYHRIFVTLTGSVKAAILLSQAMYWQKRAKQSDGWWYKTAEEWQEETGLTRHEQDKARKDCEKYLKTDLRGVPATLYWKVDEDQLTADLFAENRQTSLPESGKLDSRKSSNINKYTETTTENNNSLFQKPDILDGILEYQLKPKAIRDAFAKHFRLTPNWDAKYNRQFLEWAVEVKMTPEQVEYAAKLWGNDRRFNWSVPTLKGIQEHWLELTEKKTDEARPNYDALSAATEREKNAVPRPAGLVPNIKRVS